MEENDIKEGTFVGVPYITVADMHQNLVDISNQFNTFNKQINNALSEGKNILNSILENTNVLADTLRRLFDDITTQHKQEEAQVVKQPQPMQVQQPSIDLTTEMIEKIIKETEESLKKLSELK